QQGTYQQDSATAKLQGDVVITSSNGIEVRGQGFELRRGGHVVASTKSPVHFSYKDQFSGRSRELAAHMRRRWYQLAGNVRISNGLTGEAASSLEAKKLVYEEKEQLIVAETEVLLKRGSDQIRARRLSVTLDEAGRSMRFVSARWGVSGDRASYGGAPGSGLHFEGDQASVRFSETTGEMESAVIDGGDGGPAILDLLEVGGVVRRMTTPHLSIGFRGGELASSEAEGPVLIRDFLPFDDDNPLASGCANDAVASFDSTGELDRLVLNGEVDLHRPGFQASGNKAEAAGDGSEIQLTGAPAKVYTRSGEFDAPRITYDPGRGSGKATGGVRALLPGEGDFALLAEAQPEDEPIHLTADKASWTDDGAFTFEGAVRAWQNENFLVTDRLIGGRSGRELTAKGRVKTVIKQAAEDRVVEDEEDGAQAPVEVTATELLYDADRQTLHYTGRPRAHQGGSSLTCDDLDVFLGAESKLEELVCKGGAQIENPDQGHIVTGDKAVYRPETASVEVTGRPVVLTDTAGGKIRGGTVLYDLETGTARVQSGLSSEGPSSDTEESGEDT
ncbi:MAG: hypothetical protein OES47_10935, partial [Acidobacteriota bacterium]|nr:hypothetical protein [Acidobacteriota bacterium]